MRRVSLSPSLKLLIITPIFPPEIGGPATYVAGLLNHLPSQISASVISFGNTERERVRDREETPIVKIPLNQPLFQRQWHLFKTVLDQLKSHDICYIQGTLTVGLMTMIACWLQRKPYLVKYVGDEVWERYQSVGGILSLEQFFEQPKTWLDSGKIQLQAAVLHNAKAVITPGRYLQGILRRFYTVEAVNIPNAVEMDSRFKIQDLRFKKKGSLVYVGRLVPWKNVKDIIEAINFLRDGYSQIWRLAIIGSGPEEKNLKQITKKLDLREQVTFKDKLEQNDVIKILQTSEYCVLYSSYEGLSHTLLDAMATKTKIVASDIEPNRDVLENGKLGKLVPLDNSQKLAKVFLEEYDSQMIEKASQVVKTKYSWDNHMRLLLAVLYISG